MGERRTVLVAVADEAWRSALAQALGETDWMVVPALDANQVRARMADSSPAVVVLGLDGSLPWAGDLLGRPATGTDARRPAFLLLGKHAEPAEVAAAVTGSASLVAPVDADRAAPPAGAPGFGSGHIA